MAKGSDDESFCPSNESDNGSFFEGENLSECPLSKDSNECTEVVLEEEPRELSDLEKRRAEKIKRNMARFEALGLIKAREELDEPATPQTLSTSGQNKERRKRPSSVPVAPVRKSPRLYETYMRERERHHQLMPVALIPGGTLLFKESRAQTGVTRQGKLSLMARPRGTSLRVAMETVSSTQ